jgi:predicted ATP-grasp superfamily ATP-dependent carboligase
MLRVLITDASYKHAIALARHAKSALPDLYVIGHADRIGRLAKWHSCFDSVVSGVELEQALETEAYDMVIPVGGRSVLTVAASRPALSVLPGLDQLEVCYDKPRTIALAEKLDVPAPRTWYLSQIEELANIEVPFPCVVKASREATTFKAIAYCHDQDGLITALKRQFAGLNGETGVVVQEYVPGVGCGFFALMEHGNPLRVFMHQRIRESPPSGGRSTAARAFDSPRLRELGLRLLTSLTWHGVAMVEFKHSPLTNDFVLMEINGKFWGSLELALSAGVNFGADLIRLFRGEKLSYREDYDRTVEFYWPLDDDILTLWRTRSLGHLRDYWKPNAHTNLRQSLRADALKSMRLAKQLLIG